MKETRDGDIAGRLQKILCELLLLRPEEVKPESLLVVDLDVDSLAFIELAFTIEKEFQVEFPDLKTANQTLVMPLPDGLRVLEGLPGGTTFFEFVKAEAVRHQPGGESAGDDDDRERLFREQTAAALAAALGGRLPGGVDADAPLSTLRMGELFRFLTVGALARYVEHLMATQPGPRA